MTNTIQKKSQNVYERNYEFIEVNAATGDQFRKVSTLRSEGEPITPEMVRNFHDESSREARQWRRNNPGKSINFRTLLDENGKQVIKLTPTNELIFPAGYRVKLYDENGKQIVGEENIRREVARREDEWEQWEANGELQEGLQNHQTDDGFASIRFRAAPKRLHPNESSVPAEFPNTEPRNKRQRSQGNAIENNSNKGVDRMEGIESNSAKNDEKTGNANKSWNTKEQLIEWIKHLEKTLLSWKWGESQSTSQSKETLEQDLHNANLALQKMEAQEVANATPSRPRSGNNNFPIYVFGSLIVGISAISGLAVWRKKHLKKRR